jgi:hypothetical protein
MPSTKIGTISPWFLIVNHKVYSTGRSNFFTILCGF